MRLCCPIYKKKGRSYVHHISRTVVRRWFPDQAPGQGFSGIVLHSNVSRSQARAGSTNPYPNTHRSPLGKWLFHVRPPGWTWWPCKLAAMVAGMLICADAVVRWWFNGCLVMLIQRLLGSSSQCREWNEMVLLVVLFMYLVFHPAYT